MAALVENQFFPSVAWFALHFQTKDVFIEQHENYQKRGLRNRYQISTANSLRWMTLPLIKGKHQRTPIKEVRVSYDLKWQDNHIKTLKSAYAKAPFFSYYYDKFATFYKSDHLLLWQWQLKSVELVCELLDLVFEPKFSVSYEKNPANKSDFRDQLTSSATNLSRLETQNWSYYPQVFEDRHGFLANLSILDLLFCQGPASVDYIEKMPLLKSPKSTL